MADDIPLRDRLRSRPDRRFVLHTRHHRKVWDVASWRSEKFLALRARVFRYQRRALNVASRMSDKEAVDRRGPWPLLSFRPGTTGRYGRTHLLRLFPASWPTRHGQDRPSWRFLPDRR